MLFRCVVMTFGSEATLNRCAPEASQSCSQNFRSAKTSSGGDESKNGEGELRNSFAVLLNREAEMLFR